MNQKLLQDKEYQFSSNEKLTSTETMNKWHATVGKCTIYTLYFICFGKDEAKCTNCFPQYKRINRKRENKKDPKKVYCTKCSKSFLKGIK